MNGNNDLKYVMLPRIEEKPKIIKQQPWYKERLKEKYLSSSKSTSSATASKEKILNPRDWVFIKDGLDDFRDGLPPSHDDVLIKPSKGPAPNIKNETWNPRDNVSSASSRLTVNQRCYSKRLPMVDARREKIDQIINDLSKHPLALYSHLEESLPRDLFEDILELLDPEINKVNDETASNNNNERIPSGVSNVDSQKSKRDIRDEIQKLEETLKKSDSATAKGEAESKSVRNKYKWLLKKEEAKAKAKGPEPDQIKAEAIDNHIKNVTVEFCDWVKGLGGEHNIDPNTLTSLFASGYDTKPPISVPIHVVELTNIPAELRPNAYIPPEAVNHDEELERDIYRYENNSSSQRKHRYGAWYLPKEHWRYMEPNEKLVDPKIKSDETAEESKKKSDEINARLAPLHGAQAFKTFIKNKKPGRVPKLLEELEEWESEQSKKKTIINLATTTTPNGLESSTLISPLMHAASQEVDDEQADKNESKA